MASACCCTRNEILKLSEFNADALEEKEADRILEGLLQDAEKEFEYERKVQEHEIPALKRYFYKKSTGVHTEAGSSTDRTWNKNAEPSKKMLRDMQGGTKAKIENPEYLTLKKTCKVLMDGNKKGSQKLNQAQIEVAKIKAAGKETTSLEQRIDTFSKVLAEVRDFVAATEVGTSVSSDKVFLGPGGPKRFSPCCPPTL